MGLGKAYTDEAGSPIGSRRQSPVFQDDDGSINTNINNINNITNNKNRPAPSSAYNNKYLDIKNVKKFITKYKKYIASIIFHTKQASKNKAMLSFKYDNLSLKVNIIQIVIIIFSTAISFLESIKNYYKLSTNTFNTTIIILSTSVAIIMAVFKFLKLDDSKENVKQSIENHVFIINKFRKVFNQLENVIDKKRPEEELDNIITNYDNEIYINYISIKENFDTLFSFRETIYYKHKYKKLLVKLQNINNEIQIIDKYRNSGLINYKKPNIFTRIFCCKKHKIDYYGFINESKKLEFEEKEAEKLLQKKELQKKLNLYDDDKDADANIDYYNEDNSKTLKRGIRYINETVIEENEDNDDIYNNKNIESAIVASPIRQQIRKRIIEPFDYPIYPRSQYVTRPRSPPLIQSPQNNIYNNNVNPYQDNVTPYQDNVTPYNNYNSYYDYERENINNMLNFPDSPPRRKHNLKVSNRGIQSELETKLESEKEKYSIMESELDRQRLENESLQVELERYRDEMNSSARCMAAEPVQTIQTNNEDKEIIEAQRKEIENRKELIDRLENFILEVRTDNENLNIKLSKSDSDIEEKNSTIEMLKLEVVQITDKIYELERKLRQKICELEDLEFEKARILKRNDELERTNLVLESDNESLRAKNKDMETEIIRLKKLLAGDISNCTNV